MHVRPRSIALVVVLVRVVQALHDGKAGDSRDEYFKAVKDGLERMRVTLRSLLDLG